jgi:hypothetical protein
MRVTCWEAVNVCIEVDGEGEVFGWSRTERDRVSVWPSRN